jgi:outer membrane receptor protein involved in Fe transport
MVVSLEANNLLNKKTSVGNTDDYEIGRQIWAGLEYRF